MAVSALLGSNILVGVDLQEDWRNLVAHATAYAGYLGARVHMVHAIPEVGSALARLLDKAEMSQLEGRRIEEARGRMAAAFATLPESVRGEQRIVVGSPARVLLDVAAELQVSVLIAGAGVTEGRSRLIVGTTIDRLIRTAEIPVLVVANDDTADGLRRILITCDLARVDEAGIRVGSLLGKASGAEVTAVHVFAKPTLAHRYLGDVARLRQEMEVDARARFSAFLERVELSPGCPRPVGVLLADPDEVDAATTIVREAVKESADLIVMGLGGVNLLQRLLIGSVAERVLRTLPCSLLALPTCWAESH